MAVIMKMMNFNEYQKNIEHWFELSNSKPLIRTSRISGENGLAKKISDLNKYWPSQDSPPDILGYISEYKQIALTTNDNFMYMPHLYGARGVPMAMALYLGGKVKFTDNTVWVEPVIENLNDFDFNVDAKNVWFDYSLKVLRCACQNLNEVCFVSLPDFGDYLTCLSLLRGAENLLMDLLDHHDIILKLRDVFLNHWKQTHSAFWNVYNKSHKKCIYCFSESKEETAILTKELRPNGLFIHELL